MKTKNFIKCLFLMMLPFLAFTSCKDDDANKDAIAKVQFKDDAKSLNFETSVESQKIMIESNRAWEVSIVPSNAEWITVAPKTGENNQEITVAVSENTGVQREATLTVNLENSSKKAVLKVVQKGIGSGDAIYSENCGTDVYKINTETGAEDKNGRWPYIDQYTQFFETVSPWQKAGNDQSGIVYDGKSANVSNSGKAFAPGDAGFSDAPYIGMNGSSSVFQIKNIKIAGKTNFTFTFGAIFQKNYDNGAQFEKLSDSVLKLYASVDGTKWAPLTYVVADPVNNWSLVTAEFKVPDASDNLFIQFATPGVGSNQGCRFDDFKLVEGGSGTLIQPEDNPSDIDEADKEYITVNDLREMYVGSDLVIPADKWIKASVVSNPEGGNSTSLQNYIISDDNAGIILRLAEKPAQPFNVGDLLSIPLKNVMLTQYGKSLQLDKVPNENVKKIGTKVLAAKSITAEQLVSGDFESMYVAVTGVQIKAEDLGKNVGNSENHTSIHMQSTLGTDFVMFTSRFAKFIDQKLPEGSGVLKGIASMFGSTFQVQPTLFSDLEGLNQNRFTVEEKAVFGVSDPHTVIIPAAGGLHTISVYGNVDWTAEVVAGESVTPTLSAKSGNGKSEISVVFPENSDQQATKTATVRIATSESGFNAVDVIFTQDAASSSVAEGFPAIFDFNTAVLDNNIIKATEGNTEAIITTMGGVVIDKINGTAPKKYPDIDKNWTSEGAAWVIKVPVTKLEAGAVVNLNYEQRSSNTGPRDFIIEYSVDEGNTWVDSNIEYALEGKAYHAQNHDVVIKEGLASGNLMIRLRVNSTVSAKGEALANAGTNRLSGGYFKVTLK